MLVSFFFFSIFASDLLLVRSRCGPVVLSCFKRSQM